jgi:transposase InsO family protein
MTPKTRRPIPTQFATAPLVQHGLSVLPTRKRSRHKPKRYNRPVPGDHVQMDTCKIRPGLYQFTAIDDCSRFLVASVARHRNAKSTLAFLDQVLDEMPEVGEGGGDAPNLTLVHCLFVLDPAHSN